MAISIGSSLALHSRLPLDDRTIMETIEEMKNYPENFLPDMAYCFVKEDGKMYKFNRANDTDVVLGKWRKFTQGEVSDSSIENPIEVATNVGLIKEGTVFSAGTSVEDILKELFNGKEVSVSDTENGLYSTRFSGYVKKGSFVSYPYLTNPNIVRVFPLV